MKGRRIAVGLSRASVRAAIAELEAYGRSLESKVDELCRRLAEEGVDAAASVVRVDTGSLRDGIYMQREGDSQYLVIAYSPYAWFVEFGTGVVGSGTYPGQVPKGYGYDERRTPEAHDPNDPSKWFYYDREGNLRSTRGQSANAFMAAAGEQMRQKALSIAREVFASD